jgi:hypothetical protein
LDGGARAGLKFPVFAGCFGAAKLGSTIKHLEVLITPRTPEQFYPDSCVTEEEKQEWAARRIASGLPLPAPHRLPEGSALQAESIRRREAGIP